MAVTVSISSVVGLQVTGASLTVNGYPLPWGVSGTAAAGGSYTITSMSYSINNGPVQQISVPPLGNYWFSLTAQDIPASGTYLLAVYAFNSNGESNATYLTLNVTLPPGPPPPPPHMPVI